MSDLTPVGVSETDDAERFERHGWHGVGVPVSVVGQNGFVALATDQQANQPALSVWVSNGPGHRRESAFWMTPAGARKLALALLAQAMDAEGR